VRTPWLERYLKREERIKSHAAPKPRCIMAFDCLIQCGLRDGLAKFGQFCIDNQLAAALRGDRDKGLFFRGSERLPFDDAIRPVRDLLQYLLNDRQPATA
jgi:nitronate monooxygenase